MAGAVTQHQQKKKRVSRVAIPEVGWGLVTSIGSNGNHKWGKDKSGEAKKAACIELNQRGGPKITKRGHDKKRLYAGNTDFSPLRTHPRTLLAVELVGPEEN